MAAFIRWSENPTSASLSVGPANRVFSLLWGFSWLSAQGLTVRHILDLWGVMSQTLGPVGVAYVSHPPQTQCHVDEQAGGEEQNRDVT